jgi:branched-chain amino acid transport system substrate-binding protein
MRLPTSVTTGALAVLAVALAAFGANVNSVSAVTDTTSGPYVIGYMTELTGAGATPGDTDSVQLAVQQINAAGGIDGRKVVLRLYDTGMTASAALAATRLAISQHVDALIGYAIDDGLTASMPLIEQADIPVIDEGEGPTTSQGELGSHLAWSVSVQSDEEAEITAEYFVRTLHATSIGLANSEDVNPVEGNAYIRRYAQGLGVRSFTSEQYPYTVTDLTAQVLDLRSTNAISQWGYPQNDALLIRQLYQNGEGNIPVMLATGGSYQLEIHAIPPAQTSRISYVSACADLYTSDPADTAYVKALHKMAPSIVYPEIYSPGAYDAVFILKQAIAQGHSFATADIVDQLRTLTYHGVCGTYHANLTGALLNQLSIVSIAGYQPKVLKTYDNLASSYSALK